MNDWKLPKLPWIWFCTPVISSNRHWAPRTHWTRNDFRFFKPVDLADVSKGVNMILILLLQGHTRWTLN